MAKYISASKLCLVVLIRLFVEDHVPATASIEVLSFIGSHLDPAVKKVLPPTQKKRAASDDQYLLNLADFHALLSRHPCKQKIGDDESVLTLWDVLTAYLLRISNLHTMSYFFSTLGELLQPDVPKEEGGRRVNVLAANTPLGMFVRRIRVEFDNLQFPDVMKLWSSLEHYLQPLYDRASAPKIEPIEVNLTIERLGLQVLADPKDESDVQDDYGTAGGSLRTQILQHNMDDPSVRLRTMDLQDVGRLLEFQVERMRSRHEHWGR